MAGVAQSSMYDLRQDVDRKLARLPLKFFDARRKKQVSDMLSTAAGEPSGSVTALTSGWMP